MKSEAGGPKGSRDVVLAAVAAAVYYGMLARASQGLTVEKWDGVQAVTNGLALFGIRPDLFTVNTTRPPLGWMLLSPFVSAAYARSGPAAALAVAHAVMPAFLALAVLATYLLLRRLYPRPSAAGLALLMAANPLALIHAPFALFDILGGVAALAFFWAAYRYLEDPGRRALALCFAGYALAVATRYQFALLIAVPLLALALGRRWRRLLVNPFWLFPPAAYLACALLPASAMTLTLRMSPWAALRQSDWGMRFVMTANAGMPSVSWTYYFETIIHRLGPVLSLACVGGAVSWLSGRRALDHFLAAALLAPLALMSFLVPWKEERYLLQLLPLLYAAAGEGTLWLPAGLRPLGFAALVAFAPWGQSWRDFRALSADPALRTPAHWALAGALERDIPPGGCLIWDGGQAVFFQHLETAPEYFDILMLGPDVFKFYLPRASGLGGEACGPMRLRARAGAAGEPDRWKDGPVAKVYRGEKLAYEVYPYELRAAAPLGPAGRLP